MTDGTHRFKFARTSRLDGPQAYSAVFAFKCWVNGELFQIYAKPSSSTVARLGIVAAKRIIPHAVMRNYCKRLAREVFRAERDALTGIDVVVRPRAKVTPALSALARAEIRELLYRVQLQCQRRAARAVPQQHAKT